MSKEENPAQEYLMRVKRSEERIEDLLEERARIKALREKITASWSVDKVSGSHKPDKLGDNTAKLLDIERQLDAEIDNFVDTEREVRGVLDRVKNSNYARVLRKRYLNYKTWEQIACEMHYSYQWVNELHDRALIVVENILNTQKS